MRTATVARVLRAVALGVLTAGLSTTGASGQSALERPAEVRCPSVLGVGQVTGRPFCDVEIQTDPDEGIRIVLPARRGEATLSFNLHNRHLYSAQEAASGRAYTQYLAAIAIATVDGEILAEGAVLSEFRSADDLIDRITGGAGPTGLKAVAPTGTERVQVTVPAGVGTVVVVGRQLEIVRIDGRDRVVTLGRPVAVLSDATVRYRPRS